MQFLALKVLLFSDLKFLKEQAYPQVTQLQFIEPCFAFLLLDFTNLLSEIIDPIQDVSFTMRKSLSLKFD